MKTKEPISIYIHIPFCRRKCFYCDFTSMCNLSLQDRYIDCLVAEAERYLVKVGDVAVKSVFVGGGTPSVLSPDNIARLFDCIKKFNLLPDCEITVEGNPESLDKDKLSCFHANGVNRLSVGLQSVNDDSLKSIGRLHSYKDFLQCLDNACNFFDNINADLMIGVDSAFLKFRHTVDTVVKLPLKHLSFYALEIYPDSELRRLIDKGRVSVVEDEDILADMYDYACERLADNGFSRYEVSNFSRQSPCRHNLNYWQCGEYIGLGVAASGYLNHIRYTNTHSLERYLKGGSVRTDCSYINRQESMREFLMLGLRLEQGISLSDFFNRYGRQLTEVFDISKCKDYLVQDGDSLRVCNDKFYALNYILTELL